MKMKGVHKGDALPTPDSPAGTRDLRGPMIQRSSFSALRHMR